MVMTSDRIPCLNPRCRRTAPAEKFEPNTEIVCRKCWKLLPKRMTDEYRRLAKNRRRIERLVSKRRAAGTMSPALSERLERAMRKREAQNWSEIRMLLIAPEKPIGLDGFLEEMGMQ